MPTRNFDSRVITQRLQNQNYARNLYKNNMNGQTIISNPQNSDGTSSRYNTYIPGAQTEYYKGLMGGETVSLGGIVNISPYVEPPNVFVDQIIASLSTSRNSYINAQPNEWVKITQAEWQTLQSNIVETTQVGATDSVMSIIDTNNFTTNNIIFANSKTPNTPAIPANNYLYGFSVWWKNLSTNGTGLKVYTNNNTDTHPSNFNQVGSDLPPTDINIISYYVRKNVSSVNAATEGLLSVFSGTVNDSGLYIGFNNSYSGVAIPYFLTTSGDPGPNITLSEGPADNQVIGIQGLATPIKQWN